jgi:hypothetical protein
MRRPRTPMSPPRYGNAPRQLIDQALMHSNTNPQKRVLSGGPARRSVVDGALKR